jgi:replicative DNA helicase
MLILYLYKKQIKPTPMAIMEMLPSEDAKKAVEELGGLEYLVLCEENNVPKENLPLFINKIKQSYTRKMLHAICKEEMEFVLTDKAGVLNPVELVARVESRLADLNVTSSKVSEAYKMGDDTERVLNERQENPSSVPGLEIGMEQVDKITNGGQPGDCIVVCAESKTGKSVLLTNWATHLAIKCQIPSLYIDTEMNAREQEDRILANLTGIPHHEIVSGMYVCDTEHGTAQEKLALLKKAREELGMGAYYHIYMPHFTVEKVAAITKKFQLQCGVAALFFDYIKVPSSDSNGLQKMREDQALGFFTSGLKDIAGMLQIPVYTACQTNRQDLGNTEKDASAIGGSYRILQLASKLMFLTNKSDEQIAKDGFINGNQVLSIKYQRNGESNVPPINIMFYKQILRQVEVG